MDWPAVTDVFETPKSLTPTRILVNIGQQDIESLLY
jgi:hypothetical protein